MKIEWREFKFDIDDFTRAFLVRKYPFFERELMKMEMWYIANPRKQKKNHTRFIVNWLNRVLEKEKPSGRDYKREAQEFEFKTQQAVSEAAPPPPEWREMLMKLKRGQSEA